MAAAAAVSSAKRSLRAELKQRLRAMSAEERLRQSRLLAQEVRDREGDRHSDCHARRTAGPLWVDGLRRRSWPARARPSAGARGPSGRAHVSPRAVRGRARPSAGGVCGEGVPG